MNKLFLRLVMLPANMWQGMGADIEQLRAILEVKLKMDDRRPMNFGRQRQKKEAKYSSLVNMALSLFMGFIYMMPLIAAKDPIFGLTIFFSFLLFFMSLMLITDFSNVLFDTRDKFIIFPKPVNDKTIVLARLLHVFIYIFRIVLPMTIPGWVVIGMRFGWPSVLLMLPVVLLIVLMALFFVMAVYLLLLKLVSPSRFKDIINYFQIAISIVFFATYYLLPRIFDVDKGFNIDISAYPWLQLLPSYWLASCWSWLGFPVVFTSARFVALLAFVFPLFCFWVLIKYLAPQFTKSLAGIDGVDVSEVTVAKTMKRSGKGSFYQKLATMLNRTELGRAGFMMAWIQTARSRSFKMRVFPALAYVPVYFVFFISNHNDNMTFKESLHHASNRPGYLFLLYMCSFAMMQAINYLSISDQYKAAWVYYSLPVDVPGRIMSGAFKALWVKYFLPFFIAISIAIVAIWGPGTWSDILLAFINVSLFAACVMRVAARYLPFSRQEQMKQSGNRILKSFLAMIIPFGLGFGHYLALHMLWLKLVFMVLSGILLWLVWDSYANTSWQNLMRVEAE